MSVSVAVETSPAANTDSDVVIETRNLGKTYRDFWGRKKVQALKALDIEVKRGEIFGLLGPNGSGKSTTIKLVQGLLFPTSGRAFVFGKEATDVTSELVICRKNLTCTSFLMQKKRLISTDGCLTCLPMCGVNGATN
jgi:ABC-type glutathione transport system ATPase component